MMLGAARGQAHMPCQRRPLVLASDLALAPRSPLPQL